MRLKKLLLSDTALHLVYSYAIATISPILAIIVGIGVEVWDWFSYGRDMGWKFLPLALKDFVFNIVGIALAVLLYMR
jgi:hypothetical protein